MQIRNITFGEVNGHQSLATGEEPSAAATPATPERLRLRTVAVSPHEEYLLRAGDVRPISNELHAAILSKKGRVTITAKGVVVDREDMGGRNTYWHEDSILCNDLSARERKIFYVINPLQTDVVHLLSDNGTYLESLPVRFRPEVLNIEQQAAEMRKQQAFVSRAASRLQQLHGKETAERIAELQANSVEMQRVVQTLPAAAAAPRNDPAPATGSGRQAAVRVKELQAFRAMRESAIDLGRAVARTQPADIDRHAMTAGAEEWRDSSPDRNHTAQTPTPVEQW